MTNKAASRTILALLLGGTMGAAVYGAWMWNKHDAFNNNTAAITTTDSSENANADEESLDEADAIVAASLAAILQSVQPPIPRTNTGDYLVSHFAQSQNDWRTASQSINSVLKNEEASPDLLRRALVLSLGSGDFETAAQRARALHAITKEPDALASLTLTIDALATNQFDTAIEMLNTLPRGDVGEFVSPLLSNWASAGLGTYKPHSLGGATIHAYHGGLIAHYLKKEPAEIEQFARVIVRPDGLTDEEYEHAADLFALAGNKKDALKIYSALLDEELGSSQIAPKIRAVESGTPLEAIIPPTPIRSPADGAAQAIFDLARILFLENSDASARIFANMALALNPNLVEARVILATSNARNELYDDAIIQFDRIPTTHPSWREAQYAAASMLDRAGKVDDAVRRLRNMYDLHRDADALARIGDIYRGHNRFDDALVEYNAAISAIGEPLSEEYWYLLYARGMCLERIGDWPGAERDLQAALQFQPDHPYLLNYLGYGWADQGKNLDQAITLIKRALALQPDDGYITDSLGWVHYKFGRHNDAIVHLERAVSLLPYDPTINDHLGDAYWAVGRKTEARFQWNRARNYASPDDDAELLGAITEKLENGLATPGTPPMQSANKTNKESKTAE